MAKRRDELMALAQHTQAGAKKLILCHVKAFEARLGGMKQIRDAHGRVTKVVSTLNCRAQVSGVAEAIEHVSEIEVGETFGVFGELQYGLSPALKEFLTLIETKVRKTQDEKVLPLHPDQPRPFTEPRPMSEYQKDQIRRAHARQAIPDGRSIGEKIAEVEEELREHEKVLDDPGRSERDKRTARMRRGRAVKKLERLKTEQGMAAEDLTEVGHA